MAQDLEEFDLDSLFDVESDSSNSEVIVTGMAEKGKDTKGVTGASLATNQVVPKSRAGKHKTPRVIEIANTRDVVRHGEITNEQAEAAWEEALKEWGVFGAGAVSDASYRQGFKDRLTQALAISTSSDVENLDTAFYFNERWFSLRVLADCVKKIAGHNASSLRVFCRSYDSAYFACAIFDMLNTASNIEMRTTVALRSGLKVEDSKYGIDIFDAVVAHSGRTFSHQELSIARSATTYRTDQARLSAQSVGLPTARNDISSVGSFTPAAATPNPKASADRLTFGMARG